MKKLLLIIILLSLFGKCKADEKSILSIDDYRDINNINMSDLNAKMSYLCKKLIINKKYHFLDQRKFFEYLVVGNWHNPPHTVYNFSKNGLYSKKNFNTNELIRGQWRFASTGLEIFTNGNWVKKNILYCVLRKREEDNCYSFTIVFNDSSFFLNIDSNIVKIWSKKSPLE